MIGGTDYDNTIPSVIAPLLFAHFTATGREIEESVFSTGFMKYFIEWQLYMIPPCEVGEATYYPVGGVWEWDKRAPWVYPRRVFSRRRASKDPEQLRLAELGAWIGYLQSAYFVGRSGSWDCQNRLLFEDNWVNPRSAEQLGYKSKHFKQLGWVFMREGFGNPDDVSAIFVCQRYRWSHLDEITQNSFFLERKGELIKGWNNTILIDDDGQDAELRAKEESGRILEAAEAKAAELKANAEQKASQIIEQAQCNIQDSFESIPEIETVVELDGVVENELEDISIDVDDAEIPISDEEKSEEVQQDTFEEVEADVIEDTEVVVESDVETELRNVVQEYTPDDEKTLDNTAIESITDTEGGIGEESVNAIPDVPEEIDVPEIENDSTMSEEDTESDAANKTESRHNAWETIQKAREKIESELDVVMDDSDISDLTNERLISFLTN